MSGLKDTKLVYLFIYTKNFYYTLHKLLLIGHYQTLFYHRSVVHIHSFMYNLTMQIKVL